MKRIAWAGSVVAAGLMAPAVAQAQFSFIKIDESAANFYGLPCINNSGVVGFVRTNQTTFATGLYTGTGGPLTPIATSTTPGLSSIVTHPSINNTGVVAFMAMKTNGDEGVYKGTGGTPALIDTIPAALAASETRLSINTSGLVAYHKFTGPTTEGIFTSDGVNPVTPVATAPGATYSGLDYRLQMNDSGVVAFYGQPVGGGQGIFSSTGATFGAGAGSAIVSLNNAGIAVFSLISGGNQELRSAAAGGASTLLLDTSGPFNSFTTASINNLNQFAFLGGLDNTATGIFRGTNPVADKVIQTGDTLFGGTVQQLGMWNEGLNDSGDIAFSYFLSDGRFGIAVAHAVPGPAAVTPLLVAAACWRRRRR